MNSVKVVVPLYKTDLNESEQMSLRRSVEVLNKHPFSIICPEDLDLEPLESYFENLNWEIKRFPSRFFENIDGYNQLMLSEVFYQAFSDVDYILICQTDVFVFRDELKFWCEKNSDYIGAPWIGSPRNFWNKLMLALRNLANQKKKSSHHFFKVGNGGFSLRKVETMLKIVKELQGEIRYYQENRDEKHFHQEDVFISIFAKTKFPEMQIPGYGEALGFCIDRKPHIAYKLNNHTLPFACHGFNKPKVRKFWQPFLERELKN